MPRRSWFRKFKIRNLTFGRRKKLVKVHRIEVKPCGDQTTQPTKPIPVSNFRRFVSRYFPFLLPKNNKVTPINDDVVDADIGNNGGGDQKQVENAEINGHPNEEMLKKENVTALERLSQMLPNVKKYDQSSINEVISPDEKQPIVFAAGHSGLLCLVGMEDRLMALKRIECETDEDRRRCYLEAGAMSLLHSSSPYFPQMFGVSEDNKGVNILMEFINVYFGIEKLSLCDLYLKQGKEDMVCLSPLECTQILEKISKAVQFMHQSGFLHNDLAPWNVMLYHSFSGDFEIKIIDFGNVCSIDTPTRRYTAPLEFENDNEKQAFLTRNLEIAPELLDSAPHTTATDIYGLGFIINLLSDFCGQIASLERLSDQCRHENPEARLSIEMVINRLQSIQKDNSFEKMGFLKN